MGDSAAFINRLVRPSLLIGSMAAHIRVRDMIEFRDPKDIDIMCLSDDVEDLREAGAGDVWGHKLLDPWLESRKGWTFGGGCATLDELYTIKLSHAGWDLRNGSWPKHMSDLVLFQDCGAKVDEHLYEILYRCWEELHGPKRTTLEMSKGDFFSDAVVRIYDHDSIHDSVAIGDEALYLSVLREGAEVAMDMAKVKALPFAAKVDLFREEVYATALERIMIPKDYGYSPRAAYAWALRRTITSLTKGWSSRFMAENYGIFRDMEHDYVARHKSRAHLLIPLEGK